MLNFNKTLMFSKGTEKESIIDSDELNVTTVGDDRTDNYAERISYSGLNWDTMEKLSIANIWVRSMIDRIVERTVSIDLIPKPIKTKIDDNGKSFRNDIPEKTLKHIDTINELLITPNTNHESIDNIRRKCVRDLLKFDASGLEIISSNSLIDNKTNGVELYVVPGNSIKLNVNTKGLFKHNAYIQVDREMKGINKWDKNEMIYFMMNPQSNKVYGLSPLESLVQTVTAELFASDYNLNFFYNNATPRFAILATGLGFGQGGTAMARFRQWWNDELKGQPHKPIIIGTENGQLEFKNVGLTNDEMQFQQYSKWLLVKIMIIYKMQPAILGLTDKDIAQSDITEQVRQFKLDAVKPQLKLFANKLYQRVIRQTYKFDDVYLDFDLDLVDRKEQAVIDNTYMKMGVLTINDVRVNGLGMTYVPWGDVPLIQNNVTPMGRGKNGQTLPDNPADINLEAFTNSLNIPNFQTDSKKTIMEYLKTGGNNKLIIGWEDMEINERLDVLMKLLKNKQRQLRKIYGK